MDLSAGRKGKFRTLFCIPHTVCICLNHQFFKRGRAGIVFCRQTFVSYLCSLIMSEEAKKKSFNVLALRRIFSFVSPYRLQFYSSIVMAITLAIFAPVRPYLIQLTIDKATGKNIRYSRTGLHFFLFNTNLNDADAVYCFGYHFPGCIYFYRNGNPVFVFVSHFLAGAKCGKRYAHNRLRENRKPQPAAV